MILLNSLSMILITLKKVRSLAIFINASPQRREDFYKLQTKLPKILPIQDVKTRWNSTFLILRRAKRLRLIFDQYYLKYNQSYLILDQEQWRQVDYLLWITQPFFKYTTALSKTRDVTVHLVFTIYNLLFEHLEKSIHQLQRKRVPWKKLILTALGAASDKLRFYYSQTYEAYGDLFAIATILDPQKKLRFFTGKDWTKDDKDEEEWYKRYKQSLVDYLKPYKQRLARSHQTDTPEVTINEDSLYDITSVIQESAGLSQAKDQDDLTRYLDSGK